MVSPAMSRSSSGTRTCVSKQSPGARSLPELEVRRRIAETMLDMIISRGRRVASCRARRTALTKLGFTDIGQKASPEALLRPASIPWSRSAQKERSPTSNAGLACEKENLANNIQTPVQASALNTESGAEKTRISCLRSSSSRPTMYLGKIPPCPESCIRALSQNPFSRLGIGR